MIKANTFKNIQTVEVRKFKEDSCVIFKDERWFPPGFKV